MNEAQPGPAPKLKNGLSITSLVLGISSIVCLLAFITGIPAIIVGLIAQSRASKEPQVYGGKGIALTGVVLGAVGTLFTTVVLIFAALLLPALAKAKARAQTISCVSNMKQIGLAARMYANDHKDVFPPSFLAMSNELVTPKILVCPGDSTKMKALNWSQFNPAQNVSYEFLTPGAKEEDIISQTVFRCPIHGNIGLGDGSVQQVSRPQRR